MGDTGLDWVIDYNSAIAASAGAPIVDSGVYVGKLTKCVMVLSKGGAEGYEFEFKSNDGQIGRYINIWTRKKNGEANRWGINQINALLYLLKLPGFGHEQVGEDRNGQPIMGVPVVCNKPIAVMLDSEDFTRADGTPGYQLNVAHWLDAQTLKTSTEKHNNAEAKTAGRYIGCSVSAEAPANVKPESKPEPKSPAPKSAPWKHEVPPPLDNDLPF